MIFACFLGAVLVGCGSPASDPASGLDSRAATGKRANVSATGSAELGAQGRRQMSDAPLGEKWDRSGQSDPASASQQAIAGKSDETIEEGDAAMSPDIPEAIAKDLGSSDARIRYRALSYWETQQDQPPLTPVFEAMEDEDAAVRAKAATIVERHMDVEKEPEGS